MAIPKSVETYLHKHGVPYEVVRHRVVFTAYDLAATLKEQLARIGKTLVVKADQRLLLVILPANRRLDLLRVKKTLGASKVVLLSEKELLKAFKVKAGGMTSFGVLHKAGVLVDGALTKASHALLSAGSFTDSVRMKMKDFVKLENAQVGNVSIAAKLPKLAAPKAKSKGQKSKVKKQRSKVRGRKSKAGKTKIHKKQKSKG